MGLRAHGPSGYEPPCHYGAPGWMRGGYADLDVHALRSAGNPVLALLYPAFLTDSCGPGLQLGSTCMDWEGLGTVAVHVVRMHSFGARIHRYGLLMSP